MLVIFLASRSSSWVQSVLKYGIDFGVRSDRGTHSLRSSCSQLPPGTFQTVIQNMADNAREVKLQIQKCKSARALIARHSSSAVFFFTSLPYVLWPRLVFNWNVSRICCFLIGRRKPIITRRELTPSLNLARGHCTCVVFRSETIFYCHSATKSYEWFRKK